METLNAVGYVRVSTEEQAGSGLGLEAQLRQIVAYCTARGMNLVRVYEDAGESGGTMNRPALKQLRADIEASKATASPIHCFVISKFDRLSRVAFDMLGIVKEFQTGGVNLVSVQEGLDATTPMGKAMLTIIAAFAELERDETRARTKRALRVRIDRGQRVSKAPFGFRALKGGGLMPFPAEIEVLDVIYRLYYAEGYTLTNLGKYLSTKGLGTLSPAMVSNRLTRTGHAIPFLSPESRKAAEAKGRTARPLPADSLDHYDPDALIAKWEPKGQRREKVGAA
jgi:site-specific DNA recombinase